MTDIERLKQKTKIGMIWNALEKVSVQGISFIISVILARLLTPADYGLVGLLTVFITFSNVFIDSGFSKGLIQKTDRTEIDFSTTLIFNVVVSVVIYIILFFLSPVIAKFYSNEQLISLARILFIIIILNSLTVVQSAKLQIKLDFKKIAFINLITTVFSGIVGIFFAYNGAGVWALIIQNLIRYILLVILYWIIGRWTPKTGFSFGAFKSLFSYGSKLLVTGIFSTLITNIHDLLIGKIYKPENLGYYTRAIQYPNLIIGTLTSVLQTSTFPMLAELKDDNTELVFVFKRLIKITALCVFPAMIGLAMVSKTMIIVLLTEKWIIAADYMFWLALSCVFAPLQILNINLLNAIGRTDLTLKLDLIKIPIILLSIVITFPFGIKVVVIGKLAFAFLYYFIDCYMTQKFFNLGMFKQIQEFYKIIISAVLMGVILFFINKILVTENVMKLLLEILLGVISYVSFLIILKEPIVKNIYKRIKK